MDISDVEAAIVNAPPRHTGTRLSFLITTVVYPLQMFGRAGRNGCPARSHLLCSSRHAEKVTDQSLRCFASLGGSENRRRRHMLRFLGSSESVASGEACCDVCSGQIADLTF